jgi:GNAT superfamily N-acetyltransferase
MKIFYETGKLVDLLKQDKHLKSRLKVLTLPPPSEMNDLLKKPKKKTYIALARKKNDGKVVGWASFNPVYDSVYEHYILEVNVFVSKRYRRMGIGLALYNAGKTITFYRKLRYVTYPWDKKAELFYNKIDNAIINGNLI